MIPASYAVWWNIWRVMQRTFDKPVQIGENLIRHTVKMVGDPSTDQTGLLRFLQEFTDCPALLQCGPGIVQKFAVFHNGTAWQMVGEAEYPQ
jgi:hypothetical protein